MLYLQTQKGKLKVAKGKTLRNLCDKEFNLWDDQENFGIHTRVGYRSKYDGDVIELDLCCDCFDIMIDKLIPKCKLNPVIINQ